MSEEIDIDTPKERAAYLRPELIDLAARSAAGKATFFSEVTFPTGTELGVAVS